MANDQQKFDEVISQIRAYKDAEPVMINMTGWGLDDDDAKNLADALGHITSIGSFSLMNNDVGDVGAAALADAMRNNTAQAYVVMDNNRIGDAGAKAWAAAMEANPQIAGFGADYNQIGDAGAKALSNMLRKNPDTLALDLRGNPLSPDVAKQMKADVERRKPKNLLSFSAGDEKADDVCDRNGEVAHGIAAEFMFSDVEKDLGPKEWLVMAERLPAARMVSGMIMGSYEPADRFREFIDRLPKVDTTNPDIEAAFFEKQGDYSPCDNPYSWISFGEILRTYQENGHPPQVDDLLENGKPNRLLEAVIERERVGELFAGEHWQHAGKQDIRRLLNALPDEVRETVPNRHQLAASLSARQASVPER